MANIKSAAKRAQIGERNRLQNKSVKTGLKTIEKKLNTAVETNDKASSQILIQAVKSFDKAASKGVISKNAANRKKSKMQKKINASA
ncbi:MAG: 30S ribosomal protein S20 [Eubacteriaceae bacterium]|nr:30S ribosomal protein S20 [Eubacteriaceae bacterium]